VPKAIKDGEFHFVLADVVLKILLQAYPKKPKVFLKQLLDAARMNLKELPNR
jgi:hypothetical protein